MEPLQLPPVDLAPMMPQIIVMITALGIMLLEILTARQHKKYLAVLSLAGLGTAFWNSVQLWGRSQDAFSGMVVSDSYAMFFNFALLIGTALVILMSMKYTEEQGWQNGDYYALILFSLSGMMLMASATDLITVFLGLEILSVALYILAGFARTRMQSEESALKYFLLGSFASGFFLYGIAMIYGVAGATGFEAIARIDPSSPLTLFGIALILIGLGFKVALVPFHNWVPDVYEGAPTPVTAFMSFGAKAAGFAALARLLVGAFPVLSATWINILWILAALTMVVGNVAAITQTNIKRLLGYSSIAHAGYLLMGVIAAGENPASGIPSLLYYMLAYTFMVVGAFATVTYLSRNGQERGNFSDYRGLWYEHPLPAAALAIFMFSLAGFPPLVGFFAKYYVFLAAVESGFIGLTVLGVLTSLVSVYYYLRVIYYMFMEQPVGEASPVGPSFPAGLAVMIPVLATTLMGLVSAIFPLFEMARKSMF
ncbi:MAG: NADH-quinone oxidoreductase subunit N [Armatimonadetes bacterium]|nr:NADH-quinone oxidoreductase subunit N [Armatimonadota bacterium]